MVANKRPIIIWGSGGHAKSVARIIEAEGKYDIKALYTPKEFTPSYKTVLGYPIIDDLSKFTSEEVLPSIIAIGENNIREKVAQELPDYNLKEIKAVHPQSIILNDLDRIGTGTIIHAQSIIGPDVIIGKHVIISAQCSIGHDSIIEDFVHITPGVRLGGGTLIGRGSFLAMGVVIFPRVRLGKNVRVSANAVVNKDFGDNVILAGNPAKIIKKIASI